MHQRACGDHFGIKPGTGRQQSMKIPAMPVGNIDHGGNAKAPVFRAVGQVLVGVRYTHLAGLSGQPAIVARLKPFPSVSLPQSSSSMAVFTPRRDASPPALLKPYTPCPLVTL